MDAKEFTELFLRFEYENQMFKSRISNIHIWHYIRNNIYYTLLRMLDMSDALTNASRKNSKSRMTFQKAIRQFILCNQFLDTLSFHMKESIRMGINITSAFLRIYWIRIWLILTIFWTRKVWRMIMRFKKAIILYI